MKKIFISICLTLICGIAVAQTHDLSQDELDAFKVQCQERIDAFQMGLEIIAAKDQPLDIKKHYINTLPDLFLGGGEPWKDVDGGRHAAVKMQVSKLKQNKVISINDVPLKHYLQNLLSLKWTYVKITKAQTCMISNIYKRSDNLYVGTVTFFQFFEGRNGDGKVYRDRTQKDVSIYISKVEDGQLGTYWDLKFGDINVSETIPY